MVVVRRIGGMMGWVGMAWDRGWEICLLEGILEGWEDRGYEGGKWVR